MFISRFLDLRPPRKKGFWLELIPESVLVKTSNQQKEKGTNGQKTKEPRDRNQIKSVRGGKER